MVKVAIVEDNPLAADLLREYIESDEIGVTAVYATGEEAVASLEDAALPDVMLVDIGLPGISGIEVTQKVKARHPDIEIVIQTVFEDSETIIQAIKAGASGYILKASSREDTVKAVLSVRQKESFLSGVVARKILKEFVENRQTADEKEHDTLAAYSLTRREKEILDMLIAGGTYKHIAAELFISVHTVNNHIRKVYEKMRVHSRGEAVARAMGADHASARTISGDTGDS